MDKDNRSSRGGRSNYSGESSQGRNRRSSYEEDYAPHYSGKKQQSIKNDYSDRRSGRDKDYYDEPAPAKRKHYDQPVQDRRNHYNDPVFDDRNDPGQNAKHKNKKKHIFGKALAAIQGVLSIVVLGMLMFLDVLPMKFIAVAAVLLLLLWVFAFFSQFTKGTHIAGKIESVILCIILTFGSYYLFVTNSFLGSISGTTIKIDNIVIAVLKDDPAQTLADAADYTFGVQSTIDRENLDKTINQMNENLGKEVTTKDYDSITDQVDGLYNGDVKAIIYNEAFNGNIIENHPEFTDEIRILDNVKIETKVEVAAADKKVTKEPFTVYITGIDTYGTISSSGRSDVNILATISPESGQILLTTTPRDYYVEFPGVSNGQLDKLTHAGNYGVDCSIKTLEALYDVKIDYYVKVNFTSVVKIVDALGGLDVYSEYDFTTIDGIHFNKGYNTVDGKQALSFARERKNLPGGDNQRGKDQQAVITAMIKKVVSPSILMNYTGLLASLDGNFETNMSMNDITELIKMQLNDGTDWDIVSQHVVGSDSNNYCYSDPSRPLYVMVPNQESVDAAKAKIDQVLEGTIVTSETESEAQ